MKITKVKCDMTGPKFALISLVVLLAGCSLAPRHEPGQAPIPVSWPTQSEADTQVETQGQALMWTSLVQDQTALELVELALENNRDLRSTLLNIEAARAQYRIQRSERFPSIGVAAEGGRQRMPADLSMPGANAVQSNYTVGLGLSAFEIDLFGRVRNLSESALQAYLATEEAAKATRLSLIGEVLEAYITADSASQRKKLTQETLATRERSLALIEAQRQGGTATALDYQDAVGLTQQARAELERTDRELRQARNALAMIVGNSVSRDAIADRPSTGPIVRGDVRPGLPSDLLQRRPDIRAAERRLLGSNANIGAARAAFFPSISLTGTFGTSSAELSGLFDSGSKSWSFLPQINLPIFNGGQNVANLDLATVRKDIAVSDYEREIQQAFREVADGLDAKETFAREAQARADLANSSTEALRLSEARYRAGVDGFLRYLDTQRSSFADQISLINVNAEQQIATVRLFKALGGDWDQTPTSTAGIGTDR